MTVVVTLLLFSLGVAIIGKGGGWFADGALGFASRTGIPKIIIGATIMSFATTIPEFTVSVLASVSGNSSTALGNAIGSTVANIGLILALAVLISPLQQRRLNLGPLVAAAVALLFVPLFARDLIITRRDAIFMLAVLVIYMGWQVTVLRKQRSERNGNGNDEDDAADQISVRRAAVLFGAGAVAVVLGSRLVVQYGIELATLFGVPERVIALTLVSVGTSLPELVASVTAARRGHTDLAAGNILGANLLNLAWVIPGAALVKPLTVDEQTFLLDIPVSFAMLAAVAVGMWWGRLNRKWGTVMLLAYAAYVFRIFL